MNPKEALIEFANQQTDELLHWPIPKKEQQRMRRLGYVVHRELVSPEKGTIWDWCLTKKGREIIGKLIREAGGKPPFLDEEGIKRETELFKMVQKHLNLPPEALIALFLIRRANGFP